MLRKTKIIEHSTPCQKNLFLLLPSTESLPVVLRFWTCMVYSAMSDVFVLGIWNIKKVRIYIRECLNYLYLAKWSRFSTHDKNEENFKKISEVGHLSFALDLIIH